MKKYLYVSLFLLWSAMAVSAQGEENVKRLIHENPSRAANFLHVYEAPKNISDTPAPKGYKPFYISHYGRHGSRYHASDGGFDFVCSVFHKVDSAGLLTLEGQTIYKELQILDSAHKDIAGYLSFRGAEEHRGISQRLYERCPEVFKQSDRKKIHAEATGVQRCIQSMANFCLQLKGNAPSLNFDMLAGNRFGVYLCNSSGAHYEETSYTNSIRDSIYNASFNYNEFMNRWFKDPVRAASYFGFEPMFLLRVTIDAGAIAECISEEVPEVNNFFRHFTDDELFAYFAGNTAYKYNATMASLENDHCRLLIGKRILKDILAKADAAVAGNDHAADLRFGHDTGITPLYQLLQVERLERFYHMNEVYKDHWNPFEFVSMAANLQLIFYKNSKGDVLVKLLRSEHETKIPALKAYEGPYYKWEDLRNYFVERINYVKAD